MKTIRVCNLGPTITISALKAVFSSYGTITTLRLPLDRATQNPRGKAFIDFATPSEARAALSHGGKFIDGRSVEVNLFPPRVVDPPPEDVEIVGDELEAFMAAEQAAVLDKVFDRMEAEAAARSKKEKTKTQKKRCVHLFIPQ